jgi:hypothetical protein
MSNFFKHYLQLGRILCLHQVPIAFIINSHFHCLAYYYSTLLQQRVASYTSAKRYKKHPLIHTFF